MAEDHQGTFSYFSDLGSAGSSDSTGLTIAARMSHDSPDPLLSEARLAWIDALLEDERPRVTFTLLDPTVRVPSPHMLPLNRGLVLHAHTPQKLALSGGRRSHLPTGLRVHVPHGYLGLVMPLATPNAGLEIFPDLVYPGALDELKLRVTNRAREKVPVDAEAPLAQLVLVKVEERVHVRWEHTGSGGCRDAVGARDL